MKSCLNCNIEIDDKFTFCPQCGSILQEIVEANFCPYCGNQIETEGVFCPYCGNSISDDYSNSMASPITTGQYNTKTDGQNNSAHNTSHSIPKEQKTEEGLSFSSIIKYILYLIGGFFLLFIMKVLSKGMIKSFMREGFSLTFVVCGIIVALICYYFMYGNKK